MRVRQIILFFLSLGIFAFISRDQSVDLQQALVTYFRNYPQEKIYVQTDQCTYLSGQTIWFQLYTVAYGQPSTLSRIAYVQLIDTAGHIIKLNKLSLTEGVAHGNVLLPDSLLTGSYQLRAFSAWMLNFGEEGIFHKQITIKMATDTTHLAASKTSQRKNYHLEFFPEGGDLIANTNCNLAFKATDQDGMPADVTGEVDDDRDSVVARIRSAHDGMGKFLFRPEANRSYMASVHFPNGSSHEVAVPPAKPFGIVLKVLEQTEKNISVEIINTPKEKGENQTISLAVFQNSGKLAVHSLELEGRNNIFNIPISGYSTGILRLTVMNKDNIPLAERIVFIDKNDPLEAELKVDTLSFDSKSKSTFSVQLKGFYPGIDSLSLAVAVTDAERTDYDTLADNIMSCLLLSSELKGSVYRPSRYFAERNNQHKEALDLVMLTNGWRHFTWKKVLGQQTTDLKYAVEKSLDIAGHIQDFKKNPSLANKTLTLIIQNEDHTKFIGSVHTDSNGNFALKDYDITGNSQVSFQGFANENKSYPLKVSFYNTITDTMRSGEYLTKEIRDPAMVLNSIKPMDNDNRYVRSQKGMLAAVTVRGHLPTQAELLAKKYVSPYFEGGYYHDLDMISQFYPNSIRFFDFIKGKFPGLWVTGTEENPEFYLRSTTPTELLPPPPKFPGAPPSTRPATFKPYFYVNEISTTFDDVITIPLSDIALIRYIPPPASMAPFNGGFLGVLAIYLKKWDELSGVPERKETIPSYLFHGYSITREFYNPDYSRKDSSLTVPDYRTTLYWNTNLKPDHSGAIHFSFYNSDRAKKFRIVMEGMDGRGRPVYLHSVIAAR